MVNMAPDGPLGNSQKGLLSPLGDPLGQVLEKGLKPTLGRVTGAIGKGPGEAMENVHKQARYEIKYSDKDKDPADRDLPGGESIGGKDQTGQNPLGL